MLKDMCNAKLLFVFDVFTERIDSPKLLSLFYINIPARQLKLIRYYYKFEFGQLRDV